MAILQSGEAGAALANVGAASASGLHVVQKPIPHGALGHYRVEHRTVLLALQAANSRIFEMRNSGLNLIIPTRLDVRWLQTAAHTLAIEDSLDIFKVTTFTAVDAVNTTTPVPSVARSSMAVSPGSAVIRGLAAAGNIVGMTGGTLTKDTNAFAQLPQWLLAAQPTAGVVTPEFLRALEDTGQAEHPFVFGQNEGFIIENRVLLGAAAGSSIYIDFAYAEVTAY